MDKLINQETGLPYAKFDHSDFRNSLRRQRHDRTWQDDYMEALMDKDLDGAHVIRLRNDPDYKLDCEEKARAERVHKPLKSCREVQSEREAEMEVV